MFEGVTIDELHNVDTLFEVNIIVYKLSDTSAQLARRSLGKYANTMHVNLHETHPHSFTILRRIVIHIDVASVNVVCGNILPGWNDTN